MKTLTEMRERLLQIESDLRSFKLELEEENRNPTDEEKEEIRSRLAEADELEELIELEKRRVNLEERFAKPADEKKRQAMKPVPDNSEERTVEYGQRKPFKSLGEQLQAIMKAGMGQRVDPRLYEVRAVSGLGEGVGSDGGFLLQEDFSTQLLQDAFATGKLANMCQRITISSMANSIKLPGIDETSRASTRWGGMLGYWVEEAGAKTASQPKFRRIELNLNKLVVLVYATDELLQDASVLETVVRQGSAQEIGFQLDDAIINGSGAGRPLGILNAGCLVSQAAEAGQGSTVIFDNIIKMWSRIFAGSQTNAVWLINQNVFPQLATMSLAVGTGGAPVWLPAGGASSDPYSTLMGRPVMPIEQCASVGTVGDIILADFRNGYVLAEKGGVQSDMSIHVRFVYDESVFRFVVRVDGQPVRASALTPYKGGSSWTQSHFVALASR